MNKKKLSVVMAGAMLASSVAPVLAAEVQKSEVSASELGLLIKKVRETLESKKFANETEADQKANGPEAGLSVYYIKVNGVEYKDTQIDTQIDTQGELQTLLGGLTAGSTVEIWSKGYEEKDGKYYANKEVVPTYTTVSDATNGLASIQDKVDAIPQTQKTALIDSANTKLENDVYTITFTAQVGLNPVKLKVGSEQLDFAHFKNVSTGKMDEIANANATNFGGFATADAVLTSIADEKVEEITITSGGNNFNVEDLYDGLMLTEKGHDFLNEIKYYDAIDGNSSTKEATVSAVSKNKVTGKYSFTVTFPAVGAIKEAQVYTITGENQDNIGILQSWLNDREAKVDILAGANRYETAVNIAKEQVGFDLEGFMVQANIVLVNGNSLVDGLSASPLAAKLTFKNGGTVGNDTAAPILLTEADHLPKETKAYLKELVGGKVISNVNTTIHLVGGESVLSKSLEKELKDLGFKIVRYDGDNREETSLKVAEKIGFTNGAFVVGGEGEADAMSIAPIAATEDNGNVTPIIVSKKGGITEDAIDVLKDVNVTVVGGENSVSKTDLASIKAEANTVARIAGSNRQETNALIIEKYYSNFATGKNVVVAKDGRANKTELVDALAAANLASKKNAPIVLATNSLSKEQINALELKATGASTLYQVGNGVARDVVKTIAQRLNLAK